MKPSEIDNQVLKLLTLVETKKKQIKSTERPSWVTNCSFGFSPDSNNRTNIQTVTDVGVLVNIHAALSHRYDTFKKSADTLGVKVPFKWLGFSFEDWEKDIKTRIDKLTVKQQQDELATLEERVNRLVTPEQRRAIELEQLTKELGQ